MSDDGKLGDELQIVLKKKGCIAVPITIGGKVTCLLYSHTKMSKRKAGLSTGRLPRPQPFNSAQALAAVSQSTSLLLQKRVFAHSEPWTHFCVVSDSSVGATLLTYSVMSGAVWLSSIYPSQDPVREVTVLEEKSNLTTQALHKVGETPLNIEEYLGDTLRNHVVKTRARSARTKQPAESPTAEQFRSPKRPQPTQASLSEHQRMFSAPLPPRPPSSSRPVSQRLANLQLTGDYTADIAHAIETIQQHDFSEDSPVVKLALDDLANLEESPRPHLKCPKRVLPWRSVAGQHGALPPPPGSWFIKCESDYSKQLEQAESKKLTASDIVRLHKVPHSREEFQKAKLEAEWTALAKSQVDVKEGEKLKVDVAQLISRLAVNDLDSRKAKQEQLDKRYLFSQGEPSKLSDEDAERQVVRLAIEGVKAHNQKMTVLREKYLAAPAPTQKLTQNEHKKQVVHLTDEAAVKHQTKMEAVRKSMIKGHEPVEVVMGHDELRASVERLFEGGSPQSAR